MMYLVELWLLEKLKKLLWIVGYEKTESRLVEQFWLLKNLMSTVPTCQPHNNAYFFFFNFSVSSLGGEPQRPPLPSG